jgi:hypothetical protein
MRNEPPNAPTTPLEVACDVPALMAQPSAAKRTVKHQQVYRQGAFGGTLNTTLCGRMRVGTDGMNVDGPVTCKLCLRKLGVVS